VGRLAQHAERSNAYAALQRLKVVYSVPQVAVRLHEISSDDRRMLAFWIDYWN
jgi:hypothetical protein